MPLICKFLPAGSDTSVACGTGFRIFCVFPFLLSCVVGCNVSCVDVGRLFCQLYRGAIFFAGFAEFSLISSELEHGKTTELLDFYQFFL